MSDRFGPLVTAEWLLEHSDDDEVRVADCRWYLDDVDRGRLEYDAEHIPGATYFSLDDDLCGHRGPGRHPLPSVEAFAATLGAKGIANQHSVVAYDDRGGAIAARLWWMLRDVGHDRVAVLDGGLAAWRAAGGRTTAAHPKVPATSFVAASTGSPRIDGETLYAYLGDVTLIDARVVERYRGEVEPIDRVAGHVPTACNAPFSGNLNADETFRSPTELAKRFTALGIESAEETVVYCGSGVTACHDILAMEHAGLGMATLYPGSWSDWSESGYPVATGDEGIPV